MGGGWEGPSKRLEGIGGITGHAKDLLSAVVVPSEIGVAERPVYAKSVPSRGPKGVLRKPMSLTLVMQRRPAEPKDSVVTEWAPAGPLVLYGPGQVSRSEMDISQVQRRTLFGYEGRVASCRLRLSERLRT